MNQVVEVHPFLISATRMDSFKLIKSSPSGADVWDVLPKARRSGELFPRQLVAVRSREGQIFSVAWVDFKVSSDMLGPFEAKDRFGRHITATCGLIARGNWTFNVQGMLERVKLHSIEALRDAWQGDVDAPVVDWTPYPVSAVGALDNPPSAGGPADVHEVPVRPPEVEKRASLIGRILHVFRRGLTRIVHGS